MRRLVGYVSFALLAVVMASGPLHPRPAFALHHLAEISEVMIGFNGDPNVQFVEINQREGTSQQFTQGTMLSAFGPTGAFLGVVLTIPGNVNPGLDRKWLMGTAAFEATAYPAPGIQTDFIFSPGPISPAGGMICWGGLGLTDQTNPNHYVDCVAYGTFSGTVVPSPPKTSREAGDCQRSLTRTVHATGFNPPNPPSGTWADGNNSTDFDYAVPSPENNAGVVGVLTGLADLDGDSLADCRDLDDDNDTINDTGDNCPTVMNAAQADGDNDRLGDVCEATPYGTNPTIPDTDSDSCLDGVEIRILTYTVQQGGDRNPVSPSDFFDTPTPPLTATSTGGTRDGAVSLTDVASVLFYFGTTADNPSEANTNGVSYGTDWNGNTTLDGEEYDRAPSTNMAKPWRSGPPDGAVSLQDAAVSLLQFGSDCNSPP